MASRDIQAGQASVTFRIRDKLTGSLRGIESRLKRSAQNIEGLAGSARATGDAMASMGRRFAVASAGLAAPLVIAAKRWATFSDRVLSVGAISRASVRELASLQSTAARLGRTTSFTAVQVASLMSELGRMGFRPQQIERMTAAVLDLSRATNTDPALAANTMGATLRQFGLGASEAVRVADALTSAANNSSVTVESLAEALSYVGTTAADSGSSLEQTLALIGQLGNVSISGSSAGTATRRIIALLASEQEKVKRAFGVSTADMAGNLRPVADILRDVNTSLEGLGTAQRTAKLEEVFGLLAVTSASALGQMSEETKALQRTLEGASGTAAKTAEMMDSKLGGSIRRATSAIEGLGLAIGEAISADITKVIERATAAIGQITEVIQDNPDIARVWGAAAIAVGGLGVGLIALGSIATGVGGILATLTIAVSTMATAIGGALSSGAIIAALAPIQFQLAALVTLVSAATVVWGRLDTVVADVAQGIRLAAFDIANDFTGAFERVAEALRQGGIKNAWKQITTEMVHLGEVMSVRLEIVFQAMINSVLGKLQSLVAGVGDVIRFVAGKLPKAIRGKVAAVANDADFNVAWRIAGGEAKLERLVRELAELRDNPPEIAITFDGSQVKSFGAIISDLGRAIYDDFRSKNAKQQQGGGPVGAAPGDVKKPKGKGFVLESMEAERNPFEFSPSFGGDYELKDLGGDLIDRLDEGLAIVNWPKPEGDKPTLRDRLGNAGQAIMGPLGQLGGAIGGAVGGALPSGLRPTTGPARLDIQPTGAAMPEVPSRPTAPMMPVINRPDTGTPMSGLGSVERHMRRFFHMADAMAGAVSWFDQPKPPTIQPAFDDSPRIANAVDSLGRGISAVLSNAVAGVKNWIGIDGARAAGGPVKRGGTYLVGERGPELFLPSQSGEILPNHRLDGAYADGSRGALAAFEEKMSNQLENAMQDIIGGIKPAPNAGRVQRHLDAVSEFGGKGGPTFRRASGDAKTRYERRLSDMKARAVSPDIIKSYQAKHGPDATNERKERMSLFHRRVQDMTSRGVDPSIIEGYKQRYGQAAQMTAATAVAQRPTFQPAPGPDINGTQQRATNNIQNAMKQTEQGDPKSNREETQKQVLAGIDKLVSKISGFGTYR